MKHVYISALLTMSIALLTIMADAPVSSARCAQVVNVGSGNFNANCPGNPAAGGEWVRAIPRARIPNTEEWCASIPVAANRMGVDTSYVNLMDCEDEVVAGENLEWIRVVIPRRRGNGKTAGFNVLPKSTSVKLPGEPVTFKSASLEIACTSSSGTGTITGMNSLGKLLFTYKGCEGKEGGGTKCLVRSPGAASGELVTRSLTGLLGTVKEAEALDEVGLLLEPETEKRILLIEKSSCLAEASLTGKVTGEIGPISLLGSFGDVGFDVASGKQLIKKITVSGVEESPALELAGLATSMETAAEMEFASEVEIF